MSKTPPTPRCFSKTDPSNAYPERGDLYLLGRLYDAGKCVRKAIDLDKSYQVMVVENEDLEPLRESFVMER